MEKLFNFADLYLSRRLELTEGLSSAAFVETRAKTYPHSNAGWTRIGGTLVMFDGIDSPITQTFGLGLFQEPTPHDFEELEAYYFERSSAINHEVSPHTDPLTLSLLNNWNYQPIELTNLLYVPLQRGQKLGTSWNESLTVKICSPQDIPVWTDTIVQGWSEFQEFQPFLAELGQVNAQRKDCILFLATLTERPIAAGMLSIHDGVALLAGASTVPSGRRQGAQLALLESRLNYALEQGCDLAMMGAAPGSASQRNAERNGFKIASTRIKWNKPFKDKK